MGPFTLGELAARPDFSAASLICAEDASEDAAGWQIASFFDAFRFNPITGRVEGVFPTEKQAAVPQPTPASEPVQTPATDLPPMQVRQVAPAAQAVSGRPATQQPPSDLITESNTNWVPPEKVEKTVPPVKKAVTQTQPKQAAQPAPAQSPETKSEQPKQQPVAKTPAEQPAVQASAPQTVAPKPRKKEDFSFVRLSRSKRLQAPPSPVALAQEDVDLILPQTPQDEAVQEKQQEPLPQENQPVEESPKTEPEIKEETLPEPEVKTEELPEPETEIVSTCTLPIVNEILTQSDLPQLPEGNFPSVPLPAEPQFELKEALAEENNASKTPEPALQPAPEPGPEVTYTAPQRPSTETVNELEQELVPQNQVEDLMSEQEFLEKPTRKKAHIVLCLLLLAALVGAGWFFGVPYLRAVVSSRAQVEPEVAQPVEPVVEQTPAAEQEPIAAPVEQPTPQPAPKPVTAADKALTAVQNYQLSGNKGTVASYFDRIYASHLTQGYTANWSVEPLHKNIYIVKYRLTKTRMEPIVYVFQADAARGKLTGALNNVALDLIGRI